MIAPVARGAAGAFRSHADTMPSDPSSPIDRMLLIEVVLGIVLGALAVYFYIVPAGSAEFSPPWWVGFVLAILFFSIVIMETFRRRTLSRAEMHRALDDSVREGDDGAAT